MEWLTAAMVSHTEEYYDIECRHVPAGADAEEIRRQAHEAVAARNPGREIESVPEPGFVVPSFVGELVHVAVAWTARPAEELRHADFDKVAGDQPD